MPSGSGQRRLYDTCILVCSCFERSASASLSRADPQELLPYQVANICRTWQLERLSVSQDIAY